MSARCERVAIGAWGPGDRPCSGEIEARGDGAALLSRTEQGEFDAWLASIESAERALADDTIA